MSEDSDTFRPVIDVPEEFKHINFIGQYVANVSSFSSQYGSDTSISYTAHNINGKPSKYPHYGDFPQAFVMRTYGRWWDEAPSKREPIMPQCLSKVVSQDYIDLQFEEPVYPFRVGVYEIYNPGSVVRIWAADQYEKWCLLWEGEPRRMDHSANIFCPPLKVVDFKTRLLRLEFSHSHLDYYTELDAVLLVGSGQPLQGSNIGGLASRIMQFNIHQFTPQTNIPATITSFLEEDFPHLVCCETGIVSIPSSGCNFFDVLPDEIVLTIFSNLDLSSLSRCAQVNRRFRDLATDCILYTELNLKAYWHCTSRKVLSVLGARCKYLRKLDLSWCGSPVSILPASFIDFLSVCGTQLTHLRLNSCSFVDSEALAAISQVCIHLKDLALGNCLADEDGFSRLSSLHHLEYLDLYRTTVTKEPLKAILRSSPHLKHINLGACICITDMDDVAQTLAQNNPRLVSVDFWKTYALTPVGIRALSQCTQLEEVDLGWCLGVGAPGDSLQSLARNCRKLKKLFLAALRGVGDRDLETVIDCCLHLEQVDLLGLRSITPGICIQFLTRCNKLRLLDVSFCDQIQEAEVKCWREMFPHVSIKRSFQHGSYH